MVPGQAGPHGQLGAPPERAGAVGLPPFQLSSPGPQLGWSAGTAPSSFCVGHLALPLATGIRNSDSGLTQLSHTLLPLHIHAGCGLDAESVPFPQCQCLGFLSPKA